MGFLISLVAVAVLIFALLIAGAARWRRQTGSVRERLRARDPRPASEISPAALEALPPPVRRYFDLTIPAGASAIRWARFEQTGEFLVKPETGGWGPFSASHEIAPGAPGFLWDARIRMAPGVVARVRDSFAGGEGSMRASLFGLLRVVDLRDTPELARGALLRYLAEAVWAPTALLPAAGVRWQPIDETSARATLSAGATTVSLDFRFGADGLVASVFAAARPRESGGRFVPTPWLGRWTRWEERAGFRIPVEGEVAWLLVEGEQVYWRGRIGGADFELG